MSRKALSMAVAMLVAMAPAVSDAQTSTDSVTVPVGSPIIDASHAVDHVARAKIFRVTGTTAALLDSAQWTFAAGDSAGRAVRRVHSEGGQQTLDVTLDRKSLALYGLHMTTPGAAGGPTATLTGSDGRIAGELSIGASQPMRVQLPEAAFFGNLADLLVEALPRNVGVTYRAPVWQIGTPSGVAHRYRTIGREDVSVLGHAYPQAWVVEDRSDDGVKLLGRMWLIDGPPYVVRWDLIGATPDGSTIRVDQELVRTSH
jgi:hypothetical protein